MSKKNPKHIKIINHDQKVIPGIQELFSISTCVIQFFVYVYWVRVYMDKYIWTYAYSLALFTERAWEQHPNINKHLDRGF